MDNGIRLIVGLGNPGKEYEDTRHNAGFWLVDRLASAGRASFRAEAKFHGLAAKVSLERQDVWLLKPQTYMNASGRAVSALAGFYKIAPDEILVVHDELDLPPGAAKLKKGGGHAGHNGLRDIAAALKTPDFWRLRLGIGHPGDRAKVVDFVLRPPRKEEAELVHEAIDGALDVVSRLAAGDFGGAMNKLHTQTVKGKENT